MNEFTTKYMIDNFKLKMIGWEDVLNGKAFLERYDFNFTERMFYYDGKLFQGTMKNGGDCDYRVINNHKMLFSLFLHPSTEVHFVDLDKFTEEMKNKNREGYTLYNTEDECYYPFVMNKIHSCREIGETSELTINSLGDLITGWSTSNGELVWKKFE